MTTRKTDHQQKSFRATVEGVDQQRIFVVLPFDPAEVWGVRDVYRVTGAIEDIRVRGPVSKSARGFLLTLGPAWQRDSNLRVGDTVQVVLGIEGPQRDGLAPDILAALDAEPEAARFFDELATFYRKGYLRWIDATTKRPDVRAERIAEMVRLLKAGQKQRPR